MEAETSFSRATRFQEEEEDPDEEAEEEEPKAFSWAYDFFARCPDVEDGAAEGEELNDGAEGEEPAGSEGEAAVGVEELLKGMRMEGRAVDYAGAIYRPFREQMALEERAYFYPPTTQVPMESKVGVAKGRRDLAEEGLYVGGGGGGGSVANRNRMEHRLLRGGVTEWFGEDGELPRLPPLLPRPPRPYSSEEETEAKARYVPAAPLLFSAPHNGTAAEKEIVVGVGGVRLSHHHLFGRQHVLASRLIQLHTQHRRSRKSEHRAKLIRKKLELVREGVLGAPAGRGPRVDLYRREMQQLRAQLSQEERSERAVLKNLLKSWLELKTLRQSQGYNCVPLQLLISKRNVDPEEDERRWKEEIEAEVQEARELTRHDGSYFDEEEVRRTVERNAKANRRNIGEPEVYVELNHSAPIAPFDQCPRLEQKRRNDMRRCEMFIKVYCNDKLVTQTASKRLSEEFSVSFGEEFRLKVAQEECKLCFKIYERMANALTAPHLMAEVYVSPSDDGQLEDDEEGEGGMKRVQFADHRLVKWEHEAVGSGSDLFTTGSLHCSVCWSGEGGGAARGPRHRLPLPAGRGGVGAGWDAEKAKKWTEESQLDPNDPDNALFFHHLQSGLLRDGQSECFRLDNLQTPFDFLQGERAEEELRNDLRFRLIRLRDRQVKEFAALRMIPMHSAEVDPSIFQSYEVRLVEERRLQGSVGEEAVEAEDGEEEGDDPDLRRSKVVRYLSKVREAVWWKYQLAHRKRKTLSEVVMEDDIPDIGALGSSIYRGLTENRRPLKPTRKDRRKVTYAHNVTGYTVALLVNVANAFNVPVRKEAPRNNRLGVYGRSTAASTSSAPVAVECLVRPVVEVSFQQQTVSTGSSWGPNPCWNEDLQLEFRAPHHDLSPANLQKVRDHVCFNLFDEVSIDMLEDDRDRASHVHQRVERRWLGSFVLPFATLYLNGRVEGTFRMDTPSVLMGYGCGEAKEEVYLTLFLTLEPTLPLPPPFHGQVESREGERTVQRVEAAAKDFRAAFPKRELKMTVIDVQGKSVLVTRFVRPLSPPPPYDVNGAGAEEGVARFVSLIPLLPEVVVFPGQYDIWTTNDQFVEMLVGDQNDHSLLLCNYFLHMKKEAWLLVGVLIPEGACVVVLSRENGGSSAWSVWKAWTGERFFLHDCFCPLVSVGCVFNQHNVWLNVQRSCEPAHLTFDLTNRSRWRPLFDAAFPQPALPSLQPERLEYKETDGQFVERLESRVEEHLKAQLIRWRKRFKTSFNRHCSATLKKLLQKMENSRNGSWSMEEEERSEEETSSQLQTILSAYKMNGFPLSMAYTDLATVSEAVRVKGVHLAEGPEVEFALAVHIHPYPSNVLALWIYVATLVKK